MLEGTRRIYLIFPPDFRSDSKWSDRWFALLLFIPPPGTVERVVRFGRVAVGPPRYAVRRVG